MGLIHQKQHCDLDCHCGRYCWWHSTKKIAKVVHNDTVHAILFSAADFVVHFGGCYKCTHWWGLLALCLPCNLLSFFCIFSSLVYIVFLWLQFFGFRDNFVSIRLSSKKWFSKGGRDGVQEEVHSVCTSIPTYTRVPQNWLCKIIANFEVQMYRLQTNWRTLGYLKFFYESS